MPEQETQLRTSPRNTGVLGQWLDLQVALDDIARERLAQVGVADTAPLPLGNDREVHGMAAQEFGSIVYQAAQDGTLTYADVLCKTLFDAISEDTPQKVRDGLVQLAAAAVRAIQHIDAASAVSA